MADSQFITCSIDGCEKKKYTRGWCTTHYYRWHRHGDPLVKSLTEPLSERERFVAKVDKSGDCWLWTGAIGPNGYGRFTTSQPKTVLSHRYSYEDANGVIPDGMLVDHICHLRSCVRPTHLRLATPKQNVEYRRGANSNNLSSGVRGVSRMRDKWRATVFDDGQFIHVGTFLTVDEAEAAVKEKRAELFDFPELA